MKENLINDDLLSTIGENRKITQAGRVYIECPPEVLQGNVRYQNESNEFSSKYEYKLRAHKDEVGEEEFQTKCLVGLGVKFLMII